MPETIKESIETVNRVFKNMDFDYKELEPLRRAYFEYIKKYPEEYSYIISCKGLMEEEGVINRTLYRSLYFALKKRMKVALCVIMVENFRVLGQESFDMLNFVPPHLIYFVRPGFYQDEKKPELKTEQEEKEALEVHQDWRRVGKIKRTKDKKLLETYRLIRKWQAEGRMLTPEEKAMEIK